ncbi:MAG: RHS repeat domain-containing protein, partial [Polyangiales bacterium]
YDGDGRITAETNGNGERTEVQYDDIGREFARTYRKADGTVERMTTFGFDEVRTGPSGTYFNEGHLTSISDPNGSTTYDYDASGELVRTVRTVGGVSYTTENGFDGEGRLLWTKYPDGTTVGTTTSPRTYDDAGRLKTVPGWVNDATYDAAGRLTKLVLANGVTTERAYDVSGALKRIWTYKGTTTIQDQNYGRNALGMATTVTSNVSTESWTNGYDTQNRLISAVNTGSSSYSQSFTFDPGTYNILTNSLVGTYIYAASRPHQVFSAGGTFYNYNANGAMTNGGGRTLTWDSRGLLTRVVKGATTADFQYDGLGQRTMKTVQNGTIVTTTYVSENYVVVNGTPSIYVFFDDMLIGKQVTGAKYWLHEDQSESLARITDSTGALVRSRAYRPFGETLSSTGTVDDLHAFLGEELDETGLLHLNARYYDPSLGVFVSPDSLIPQTSLDAFNPYAYSAGDPINQGDRSGNSWSKWGTYSKAADKAGDESKGLEALEKNWNILTSAISPAQKHHKPIAIGMAGINNKWKKKNYTNGFTSVSGFAGSGGSCPLCLWLPNWNLKKGLFSQTNQAELAMAKAMVRRAVDHGLVVRLQAHSNGHAALRDLLTSYANNGGDWRRIASVHMIAPAVDKKSWRSILSTASAHGVSINAFMFEHDTPMSAANSTRVDGNTNNSHDFDDNMAPEHFKQLAHSYPRTHVRLLKGSGHKIQKILDTVQDRFGKKVAHGYYRPRVMFDGRKITASGRSE